MAKRNSKIPGMLSLKDGVYPVTTFRSNLQVSAIDVAGQEKETVDFDLQFEDNEVMDILMVEYSAFMQFPGTLPTDTQQNMNIAISEDPDIAEASVDINTEAVLETNASIVHAIMLALETVLVTSGGRTSQGFYAKVPFPQPYTVARNVAILMGLFGTAFVTGQIPRALVTLWARRRKASDAEFKNIIYRQRF